MTQLVMPDHDELFNRVNDTLAELVKIMQQVVELLEADDFDPDQLATLQAVRGQLYDKLKDLSTGDSRQLSGNQRAAEVLTLEQQAHCLATEQRDKATGHIQEVKQQKRIAQTYAGQSTTSAGRLFDVKDTE